MQILIDTSAKYGYFSCSNLQNMFLTLSTENRSEILAKKIF